METIEDPGSVRRGNFINYYEFNPSENRIRVLRAENLVELSGGIEEDGVICLDVGCNAGELSAALQSYIKSCDRTLNVEVLGVDIDPILIERANSQYGNNVSLQFEAGDILDSVFVDKILHPYLKRRNKKSFDFIFCFSLTMWIHINEGDKGLETLIRTISGIGSHLILEPQPWKCYLTARRRAKRSNKPDYDEIKNFKGAGEEWLKSFYKELMEKHGFEAIKNIGNTNWKRSIVFYGKQK